MAQLDQFQERRRAQRLARRGWSIDDIKRENEAEGFFFFSPDTMRFFRSRVMCDTFKAKSGAGVYFVTSDQQRGEARLFTVRRFEIESADIRTVDKLQKFASRSGALAAAKRAAEAEE